VSTRVDEHRDRADNPRAPKSLKTLALIYAPPAIGWLLVGLLTVIAWQMWGHGTNARPLFAMGALSATAGLALFVAHQARTRGPAIRWLATCTVAATGLWVITAVLVGPATRPVPDLYFGGGAVACAFWMSRRALMSAKNDGVVPGQAGRLLSALDGARVAKVATKATKLGVDVVHAEVEVNRGEQTVRDLQDRTAHVETVLGLRPNSVTVSPHPNDAGRAQYLFAPVDPLAQPIGYTGPDRPGRSIAEPIRLGPYLDGSDCEIIVPGNQDKHRNLAHLLVQGVTGAGKSEGVRKLMTDVLCRTEVTVVAADPVKGLQTLGVFVETGALELVALEISAARALLAGVARAVKERGMYLGARGYKQWASGCGLTLLVVWLEEANWATQSATLEKLAAECRSVGIWLLVSQQRASHTKTNTDLRANLPAGWCFGVANPEDAAFNLPDEVIDAGAHPEVWGNRKPGYSYLVHPSVAEADYTKIMRPELATDEQIRQALTTWAHARSPMDEVTRAAFGAAYDQIRKAMAAGDTVVPATSKQLVPDGIPAEVVDDDDLDGFDEADLDDDVDDGQSDDDGMPPVGSPVEPDIHVNPDEDITAPPPDIADVAFGNRPRRRSTEDARAVVQAHLRALADAGHTHAKAADVAAMKPPTGRSREWIRQELHRLCTAASPDEIGLEQDLDADQPGMFLLRVPALAGSGR
jgi:DNA translocase FtsK/SpoIIIE-like protein